MKPQLRLITIGLATLAASAVSAFGWGANGHRITAEVGERNLSAKSKAVIASIIGDETLAEIATWPDDIRSDGSWDFVQPWHYLSIDDDEAWEGLQRAPQDEGDVVAILERLEKFLRDPEAKTIVLSGAVKGKGKGSSLKIEQRKEVGKREALAFYVHFIGDVHQPLHVGRRDDLGGNKIGVQWFGEETNLHKVWDESLIESAQLSFTEFATFLNRISADDRRAWVASGYLDWAKESKAVRSQIYDFGAQKSPYYLNVTEPPALSWSYRHKNLPLVRSQLAKAGIRLAAKLDEIFADYPG